MRSQKSPMKGAVAKSPKSPIKSLPSPKISGRYSNPSWSFDGIAELTPASSNGSEPEYHANPDEISLSSSEDAELAGPISDPQLLIEEIHDHVSRSYLAPPPSPLSLFLVPSHSTPANLFTRFAVRFSVTLLKPFGVNE